MFFTNSIRTRPVVHGQGQGVLQRWRHAMPLRVLALALVVALMHLVESQAKPRWEGPSGMHARSACCCAKSVASVSVPRVDVSAPTESACCQGPAALAAPAEGGCCAGRTPQAPSARPAMQMEPLQDRACATTVPVDSLSALAENEEGPCCSRSGASCACHHNGPTVTAWVVGAYTIPSPLAPKARHAIVCERLCQRPCVPPEQPPRA